MREPDVKLQLPVILPAVAAAPVVILVVVAVPFNALAVPVRLAVIVPALKLPLAFLCTI